MGKNKESNTKVWGLLALWSATVHAMNAIVSQAERKPISCRLVLLDWSREVYAYLVGRTRTRGDGPIGGEPQW